VSSNNSSQDLTAPQPPPLAPTLSQPKQHHNQQHGSQQQHHQQQNQSQHPQAQAGATAGEKHRRPAEPQNNQTQALGESKNAIDYSYNKIFVGGLHYDTRDGTYWRRCLCYC
jgi:FtsZ-interacting cell division protein ZipA